MFGCGPVCAIASAIATNFSGGVPSLALADTSATRFALHWKGETMGTTAIGPGPSANRRSDLHPKDWDYREAQLRAGVPGNPQQFARHLFAQMQARAKDFEEDDNGDS